MFSFRSLRRALPIAALLATTAVSIILAPTAAKAWEAGHAYTGADGSTVTLWYQEGSDGLMHYAVTIEKGDRFDVYLEQGVVDAMWDKIATSNPDPNGSAKGTEKPDVIEMLKKATDLHMKVKVNVENSPLSKWIDGGGGGFVPHWNPSDDDNQGPASPPSNKKANELTPDQIANLNKMKNAVVREGVILKEAMGDGGEGGSESAPGMNKNNKSNNGNGNSSGHGSNEGKNKYFPGGEALGVRPDLVNPPIKNKTVIMKTNKDLGSSDKGNKSAGGSNVMTGGLLEGGDGFASGGPSSAGSVQGGGSGGVRAVR